MKKATKTCGEFNHLFDAQFKPYIFSSRMHASFLDISFLFHYTKKELLPNFDLRDFIKIEFSKASDFLDKNEGLSILEPYYHACGYLYDKQDIDKDFFDVARSIHYTDITSNRDNTYIICFSANGFSSFLKERYSARDGVLIPVNKRCLDSFVVFVDSLKKSNGDNNKLELILVSYSLSKMKAIFVKSLKSLYRAYTKDIKDPSQSPQKIKKQLKNILVSYISSLNYAYKSSDYKREEEIRLIFELNDKLNCRYSNEEITLEYEENIGVNLLIQGNVYDAVDERPYNKFNSTKFNKNILEFKN